MDQGVGSEIKRLREERGWSQAKLAVEAEMSVSGVSMIENGQRNLTTTTLAKLAGAFGLEIADLFPKVPTPQQLELEERRGADEERRCLSAILDPYTKELRHLSETYGPHLRLLPPTPPPDDLPQFSWVGWFRQACIRMDRMTRDSSFSTVVGPWLSRMNDETIPADIRQKLHDFHSASTDLFDEVEPIAEEWIDAQKDRLPDEWAAKWRAEFESAEAQ